MGRASQETRAMFELRLGRREEERKRVLRRGWVAWLEHLVEQDEARAVKGPLAPAP